MATYTNIETRNFPGKKYRVGYSNLGPVHIYGSHGRYNIYMGRTPELESMGIAGKWVRVASHMSTVSSVITHLSVSEIDGRKVMCCL